jgi:hypothetical protein
MVIWMKTPPICVESDGRMTVLPLQMNTVGCSEGGSAGRGCFSTNHTLGEQGIFLKKNMKMLIYSN